MSEGTDHLRGRTAQQNDVSPRSGFQWHDEPAETGSASPPLIPERQREQTRAYQPDTESPESEHQVLKKERSGGMSAMSGVEMDQRPLQTATDCNDKY